MKLVIGTGILLIAAGCQNNPFRSNASNRSAPTVDDSMLVYVPAAERSAIGEARAERDEMEDGATIAERDIEHEKEILGVAEDELDVANTQVDNARNSLVVARKSSGESRSNQVEKSNQQLATAQDHRRAAQSKVAFQQAYIDQRKSEMRLANLRVDLADARVELAKATAVQRLDRPEASTVPLTEFERRVEDKQTEVELAMIDVDAWKKKVELRKQNLDAHDAASNAYSMSSE